MAETKGKSYDASRALLAARFDDERIAESPRDPHEGSRYPSIFSTSPLFADFDETKAMEAGRREVARYVAAGIPREALSHNAEYDLGLVQEMQRLKKQGKLSPAHQDALEKMMQEGANQGLSKDLYKKAVQAGLLAYEGGPSQELRRRAANAQTNAPTEAAEAVRAAARTTAYETRRPVMEAEKSLAAKKRSGY